MSTYIVAEMSANHCGNLNRAKNIIRAAKDCGANAVKLQTYTADTITLNCRSEVFKTGKGTLWEGRYMYDLYQEASTPWEWYPDLLALAGELGIDIFSSPFDFSAVDFLASFNMPRYKIASPEAMDYPLIAHAARQGKPMIISTGMASLREIEEAVATCFAVGNRDVTLLKCTSQYPASLDQMHLATIPDLHRRFGPEGVKVGLSDHSMRLEPVIAAVAMGAVMVEKHFILDRESGGIDSGFSLNPKEFALMVDAVRSTEAAIGQVDYAPESPRKRGARSLFVVNNIQMGERFGPENIRSIRPSHGLHPRHYYEVMGATAACDLQAGTPLKLEHIVERKDLETL